MRCIAKWKLTDYFDCIQPISCSVGFILYALTLVLKQGVEYQPILKTLYLEIEFILTNILNN